MGCIILIETYIKKPVDMHIYRLFALELVVGIEPTTCSLRMSCSAIEPHKHIEEGVCCHPQFYLF